MVPDNGNHRILFVDGGKRPQIRLGKIPKKTAQTVLTYVEKLHAAKRTGSPIDGPTAEWLKDISPDIHGKLSAVGLVPDRQPAAMLTLGAHLDGYFAKRTDVKSGTLKHWRHTKRCLVDFFTADRDVTTITPGEAKDFERWLKTGASRKNRYVKVSADEALATNTARKRISNTRQFFADLVDRHIIPSNPFAGLKGTVGSNRERDFFIDRAACDKILKACPTTEWKVIFALARFGGLRCPSEILALRWEHINWAESRMLVHAPKTEHHEGKATRLVPIFPELRKYLDDLYHELPDGTEGTAFVITRYRDKVQNLRTTFGKIIVRAGLEPWPKLFQNLRASRSTELAKEFPGHVAAAWLGHSTLVASKHYWQVTEDDFAKALQPEVSTAQPEVCTDDGTVDEPPDAHTCAQIPAQQASEVVGSDENDLSETNEKTRTSPGSSDDFRPLHTAVMGGTGFEPVTSTV